MKSNGSRSVVKIPVATTLSGTELAIHMHVVKGAHPGPTLALLSSSHGAEFLSIEQVRAVIEAIDPSVLRGKVLAVPVANPAALQEMRICASQDEINMNRIYPGGGRDQLLESYAGGLTEYAAHLVSANLIDPADVLLDFHLGPWGQAVECIDLPAQAEGEVERKCLDLAVLFGVTVHKWPLPPGSAVGYALSEGKVALGVELGGGGFGDGQSRRWVAQARDGVLRVMASLGMLDGGAEPPADVWICTHRAGIRPAHGGYHVPEYGVETYGQVVPRGSVVGRTYNTQTFDLLEEMRAPYDGVLYLGRCYGPVKAGDWGYCLGEVARSRRWSR